MNYLAFTGTKYFRQQQVFHNLSFEMKQGEILSMIGPSGTGKTTLLRCIAGLEKMDSGELWIDGEKMTGLSSKKRQVLLMFQEALLFPHLTVCENVEYGLKLAKIPKNERRRRIAEMLEKTEMESAKDKFPDELSGGEQQRVSLARALVMKPKLLLLDEPFASLDPILREKLMFWVKDMIKEQGVTAIFVTHDMEEAMVFGDEVAIFNEGTFQQKGKPEDIYYLPNSLSVAAFYSDGIVENGSFYHSKNLMLSKNQTGWDGLIKSRHHKFGKTFYTVNLKGLNQLVTVHSEETFSEGEQVSVHAASSGIFLFEDVPIDEKNS